MKKDIIDATAMIAKAMRRVVCSGEGPSMCSLRPDEDTNGIAASALGVKRDFASSDGPDFFGAYHEQFFSGGIGRCRTCANSHFCPNVQHAGAPA